MFSDSVCHLTHPLLPFTIRGISLFGGVQYWSENEYISEKRSLQRFSAGCPADAVYISGGDAAALRN